MDHPFEKLAEKSRDEIEKIKEHIEDRREEREKEHEAVKDEPNKKQREIDEREKKTLDYDDLNALAGEAIMNEET